MNKLLMIFTKKIQEKQYSNEYDDIIFSVCPRDQNFQVRLCQDSFILVLDPKPNALHMHLL